LGSLFWRFQFLIGWPHPVLLSYVLKHIMAGFHMEQNCLLHGKRERKSRGLGLLNYLQGHTHSDLQNCH
jgi:hypothetical protein